MRKLVSALLTTSFLLCAGGINREQPRLFNPYAKTSCAKG
jgi:hypothetical protein